MAEEQNVFLMSQEGYDKLVAELEYEKNVHRAEVAEKIRTARGFGDLSENAEYDEAKKEQAFMEGHIAELENTIKHAQIVDYTETDSSEVNLGSTVTVVDLDFEDDGEETYTITGSTEANITENRISNESPMGEALMGKHPGDVVEYSAPAGTVRLKIIEVSRK